MLSFSGNKVKVVFGYSMFNVVSPSMQDELPVGSLIIIKETDAGMLQVGDNITFFSDDPDVPSDNYGNRIVTHKIMEIINNDDGSLFGFVSKGVNNPVEDPYPVRAENVIGKVVYSSLSLGKAYDKLSTRGWSFVLTVVPLFVIVVIAFIDFVFAFKRVKEERAIRKKAEEIMEKQSKADKQ